jgi:hypothetical protein
VESAPNTKNSEKAKEKTVYTFYDEDCFLTIFGIWRTFHG